MTYSNVKLFDYFKSNQFHHAFQYLEAEPNKSIIMIISMVKHYYNILASFCM